MRILLGDTRSRRNQELFQVNGWGRMFASDRPFPPFFYPSEVWGFDNGAFVAWTRGNQFPEGVFLRRLDAALRVETGPAVAVCPDIVAGGLRSLEFSVNWLKRLPSSWPWYLAVQDGTTRDAVLEVVHLFAGIFLGGTDRFKLTAYRWSRLAQFAGKKFHYGRAGTLRMIRHAYAVEADSLDSNFPLWTVDRMRVFRDEQMALERQEQGILVK